MGAHEHVCMHVCVRVSFCVSLCVCVRVRACVCVCVCVWLVDDCCLGEAAGWSMRQSECRLHNDHNTHTLICQRLSPWQPSKKQSV